MFKNKNNVFHFLVIPLRWVRNLNLISIFLSKHKYVLSFCINLQVSGII